MEEQSKELEEETQVCKVHQLDWALLILMAGKYSCNKKTTLLKNKTTSCLHLLYFIIHSLYFAITAIQS